MWGQRTMISKINGQIQWEEEDKIKTRNTIICLSNLIKWSIMGEREVLQLLYFQKLLQNITNEIRENSYESFQKETLFSKKVLLNSLTLYIWIAEVQHA